MPENDDDEPKGCCHVYSENAVGGKLEFDDYTEKQCKEAGDAFGKEWRFYPGQVCSEVDE